MKRLAIAKLADHLEHFRPRGVHALVDLLIGLDRHYEFELFSGHFTFLSSFAIIRAATPRPAAALQARVRAAFKTAAALGAGIAGLVARHPPAIQSSAAIDNTITTVGPLPFLTLFALCVSTVSPRIGR